MAGRCREGYAGVEGKEMAVDREEWASVIKRAKALRGPQSQGVNK